MAMHIEQPPESTTGAQTVLIDEFPLTRTGWFFLFLPQCAIFVFIAVCLVAIVRNGGPFTLLAALLPILLTNILSIFMLHESSQCS